MFKKGWRPRGQNSCESNHTHQPKLEQPPLKNKTLIDLCKTVRRLTKRQKTAASAKERQTQKTIYYNHKLKKQKDYEKTLINHRIINLFLQCIR